MKNKKLLWLLGGLGVLAVVLTIISYLKKPSSPSGPVTTASPTNSSLGSLNNPLPITDSEQQEVPNPATRLDELAALGVDPNNIYQNNQPIEARSDATLVYNSNFTIIYLAQPNQFQLTLYQEPFTTTQTTAEQALLTELKISQEVACKLPVVIVKDSPDPNKPNEVTKKLSFCP